MVTVLLNRITDLVSESQEFLPTLDALNLSSIIWITDKNGYIVYINEKFAQLLNKFPLDINNQTIFNFFKGANGNQFIDLSLFQAQRGELILNTYSTQDKWLSFTAIPFNSVNNKNCFLWIASDISKEKETSFNLEHTLKSLEDLKNALDVSAIVAVTNKQGIITYVNDLFCSISQYTRDELIGKTHRIINSGQHSKSFFKDMWDTILAKKVWRGEVQNRAKNGSYYWTNTTIIPYLDTNGEPYQFIAIRHDITNRIQTEKALEQALKNDFQRTIEHLQNCVFKAKKDSTGKTVFTLSEGKLAKTLKITTDRVKGYAPIEIFPAKIANKLTHYLELAFNGEYVNFELPFFNYHLFINLSPIFENKNVTEIVGSLIDLTEQKKNEALIYQLAHYDNLTDLPNRAKFHMILDEEIEKAKRRNLAFSILFINLDRFKAINDMFGHSVGDELLVQVSQRLLKAIGPRQVAARFGGDEFMVLLRNTSKQDAEMAAKNILHSITEKFQLDHGEIYITTSIGISIFSIDGTDAETLLKKAEAAMYNAKTEGKSIFRFFDSELQTTIERKLMLETGLREAIEKNQLFLHYQPKISAKTGELTGAESLLRWTHPTLGNISPMEFIPIAEETGLIIPIGEWVLETTVRQTKHWFDQGLKKFVMSINVSVKQLTGSNFIQTIANIIKKYNINPKYLEIEITESATLNIQEALKILHQIKQLGVEISIDDFGTGYSSLKYLGQLPIDSLKIDQSFIRNLTDINKSIVKTIIDLAQNMNLSTVAEGVETGEHVAFLKAHHCTHMQGYYFSRPVATEAFEELLSKQQWVVN